MKKALVVIVACAVLAAVGAVLITAPAPKGDDLPVFKYGKFPVYDAAYIAQELGLYEKHGIKVEFIGGSLAGPQGLQAVSAGSINAALVAAPAVINGNAAGLPVQSVLDCQSSLPNQSVEYYITLKDSPIRSAADLGGRTVAVNILKASFHYTLLMALDKVGVPEKNVTLKVLPFDQQEQALMRGQVDMISVAGPYAMHILKTYPDKVRTVFTDKDVFGNRQFCTIIVNRVWAKDHAQEVRAFVGATAEATHWVENGHQQEGKQIIARATGLDVRFIPDYHWQPDDRVVPGDFQFWLDYMRGRGDIKVDWLKIPDMATNEYNPYVNSK